jgi:beta-mannosidase
MRTEVTPSHHTPTQEASPEMEKRRIYALDKSWVFKQADKESSEFLPVAQFPTNIHLDLIANNIIPDPFIGKNELDVQWVGEAVWIYRTHFPSPSLSETRTGLKAILSFDGLDTYATVVLNGKEILKTESMFVPERVDVTALLKKGEENELEITFDSAYLKGWELVEKYPNHKWGCWNGDNSRLPVRKAQYHWVSKVFLEMEYVLTGAGLGLGPNADDLRTMETHQPRNL